MLKKYPKPATRAQQAHQLWPILTAWAQLKVVGRLEAPGMITYGEAAKLMGYSPRAGRTLGGALGLISGFCEKNELPHLNAIVVDFETGEPGEGVPLAKGVNILDVQKEVLRENWFAIKAPSMRNLRDLQGQYPLV